MQTLWHLREFREEFISRSHLEREHVGSPRVVCAFYEKFSALKDNPGEAAAFPLSELL